MKNVPVYYIILFYLIFLLSPSLCFPQNSNIIEPDSNKSEINKIFDVLNHSLKTKDLNRFISVFSAGKDLLYVGIDINSLAFDSETLKAIQDAQFKVVDDLNVKLNDRKIILSDDKKEARYYQDYNLSFKVYANNFKVDNVKETGVLQYKNGKWIIVQQHVSVPVTNDVWPAYLAKNSFADDPNHEYGVTELLEDFDLFTLALEEAHSGLYRFNTPENYKMLTDSIKSKLNHPMTELDFYRLICPIISFIKCGHTRMFLSDTTEKYLNEQNTFIPCRLKFITGKTYLLKNVNGNTIQPGSEILSINDRSMPDIVRDIFSKLGSDGDILTAKYSRLDDMFPKLYCQLVEKTDKFKIKYIQYGNNKIDEVTVNGVNDSEWNKVIYAGTPPPKELLSFKIMKDSNIAIIDIRKFVSQEINAVYGSFSHFADSAFVEIKRNNIHNLIIDLRGNGGGDIERELIPYLVDKPVKYFKIIDTHNTRYSFLEHTNKGIFFNNMHVNLWKKYRNEDGRYELTGNYNEDIIPNPLVYKDSLYILIDGGSFSGTSQLSSILYDRNRALFIGEETGGCTYGSCSGDYLNLSLPHTQIKVVIPIRNYVMNISGKNNPKRGVLPDYEITETIKDVLSGKDMVMKFGLDYILGHK